MSDNERRCKQDGCSLRAWGLGSIAPGERRFCAYHQGYADATQVTSGGLMDRIVMYTTQTGWRWTRYNGENGLITGASSQEYTRQEDARHNIETTQKQPYDLIVNGDAPAETDEVKKPGKGKRPIEAVLTDEVLTLARSKRKWKP